MRGRFSPLRLAFAALIVITALGNPQPAQAAALVVNSLLDTTANDANCTLREAILAANGNASANGCSGASFGADTITFSVNGTITLGSTLPTVTDAAGLTINGGNVITVSGNDTYRLLFINSAVPVTLTHISLVHGFLAAAAGAGIYNQGRLVLDDVLMERNVIASSYGGGAIVNTGASARLTVQNSTLRYNSSAGGGAIYVDTGVPATITGSTIFSNTVNGLFGGGITNAGTITLTNSLVNDNVVTLTGANPGYSVGGGGLTNYLGATAIITGTTFSSNRALNSGGGAILNTGTLTMTNSGLYSNTATGAGGAVLNDEAYALATVTGSTFSGNTAVYGAAMYLLFGTATFTNSTLSGNHADYGGGIYALTGYLTVSGSTLSGNSATYDGGGTHTTYTQLYVSNSRLTGNSAGNTGGGMYAAESSVGWSLSSSTLSGNHAAIGGGLANLGGTHSITYSTLNGNTATYGGGMYSLNGTVQMTNSTISGNTASNAGGGMYADYSQPTTVTLRNVTIANNSAVSGGASRIINGAVVNLTNSILAYSLAGGNCSGIAFAFSKYSTSSDNTCALAGTGDQNLVDPLLTGLGNYGGLTQTHMLKTGSPALDSIVGSDAPGDDQRGFARPQIGGFDRGAVERRSVDSNFAPRIYLPAVIR